MKNVLRLLTAVLVLCAGVAAPTATTTPAYDTVHTYYDGDNFATANIVGRKWEMCSGTWYTGTTSGYVDLWYGENCSTGVPSCQITESNDTCNNCGDNIDNDNDGKTDADDPNCWFS